MGGGIAPSNAALVAGFQQICGAIDYDFSSHKCYIHSNPLAFCPANTSPPPTPLNLVANPSVVNVILCKDCRSVLLHPRQSPGVFYYGPDEPA